MTNKEKLILLEELDFLLQALLLDAKGSKSFKYHIDITPKRLPTDINIQVNYDR